MRNHNITKNEIAIVVLSFDGFKELWQPFFDFFFKSWPDCPYNIYLLNNYIKFNDKRVNNLLVNEDISWGNSLSKGLEKISEKRVFFLYDDCFIYKINKEKLKNFFQNSIDNNIISLQIRPSYFISKFGNNEPTLIPKKALYRNALFCNLIMREHLLLLIKTTDSAWDFELKGNIRSHDYDYFSIRRPCIDYHHGIVKGKWFLSVYKKLISMGYKFEKLDTVMSNFDTIKLKLKTIIHDFYTYIFPLNIVLFIENKRKGNIYKK